MRGITLIETLIYLAIFSMLLGSAVTASYSLASTANAADARLSDEESARFVEAKINWALSQTASIEEPSSTGASSTLILHTSDATLDPIVIKIADRRIVMSEGTQPAIPLTKSSTAAQVSFSRTNEETAAAVVASGTVGTASFRIRRTLTP